jgi:hypothetical protein
MSEIAHLFVARTATESLNASYSEVPVSKLGVIRDNAAKNWVILLEAGTIIGPAPERLRVAQATLDRKVVKKYNILLRAQHFLVVEGYDPRIHALRAIQRAA